MKSEDIVLPPFPSPRGITALEKLSNQRFESENQTKGGRKVPEMILFYVFAVVLFGISVFLRLRRKGKMRKPPGSISEEDKQKDGGVL
jgi:hypothetical protein